MYICVFAVCVCVLSLHTITLSHSRDAYAEQKSKGRYEGVMMCDKSMLESICLDEEELRVCVWLCVCVYGAIPFSCNIK